MRSLLFVPADSERKLSRAPQSGADALILDLEDSVVPANRRLARGQARDFHAVRHIPPLCSDQPIVERPRARRFGRGDAGNPARDFAAKMHAGGSPYA